VSAYIDRRTDDNCDDARDLAQLVLSDTIARKPSIVDDFTRSSFALLVVEPSRAFVCFVSSIDLVTLFRVQS
jgi:hypothetical protein